MFNKEKYQKCIGHLVSQKFTVIFVYLLIFAAIGVVVGSIFMFGLNRNETVLYIGIGVGLFIGLIVGISSVWKIDMKIQEAYWRIDILSELKKQNLKSLNKTKSTDNTDN